ncbi:MAG TPA: hypothetical protein DF699_10715, partial [Phycisphaerales bacterium]|nr:hypothetical protein [Phycisphaerales bacterium]
MRTHAIRIAALLLASSAQAQQSSYYEISKDGHLFAVNLAEAPTGQRGVGVPFNAKPDQSVELRRQIGGLKVVDIDGDGNNDIVAVCYISNSFPPYDNAQDMIFFGNGAGINLTPGWLSNEDTHTGDVQVGDLDGDDRPDIVTIHGGLRRDSVRAYFNTGAGMSTA